MRNVARIYRDVYTFGIYTHTQTQLTVSRYHPRNGQATEYATKAWHF